MFSFIERPNTQANINKIATITVFLFILSLPLSNALMNTSYIVLLLLYFLGGNYAEKISQIKSNKATILFLLLFAWTLIAASYSYAEPQYIQYDLFKYKKLLLIPILIYFLNGKDLSAYVYTFLVGTALMILYTLIFDQHGLILSIKAKSLMYSANPIRNYITEGVYLTITLFASLWFIKCKIHRPWMLALLTLVLIQIIFNNGRMALISVAFTLLILINFSIKKVSTKVALAMIAVGLAYLIYAFVPLIHLRVDKTIAEASQIVNFANAESIRLQYWHMSWEKFITRPIIGFGPGTFQQLVNSSDVPGEFKVHVHAHNEYIFMLLQYGIVGLALLLGAIFSTLKGFNLASTSPARVVAFTGILVLLLNCITDCHLYNMNEGNVFVLMLALYLTKDKANNP